MNSQTLVGNVADLFTNSGSLVGFDQSAISAVIGNLNQTTLPMCQPLDVAALAGESDDQQGLVFLVDVSASMEDVIGDLIAAFNEEMIGGLRGASKETAASLRIAVVKFSSQVTPLWNGQFLPLDQVPMLTAAELRCEGSTALHQAQLDGMTAASNFALQIMTKKGVMPRVQVVAVTDGANNRLPKDASTVRAVASKLNKELFVLTLAGYKTWESVNVDYKQVGRETGFDNVYEMEYQAGQSLADRQKAFRHFMGTLSSQIVSTSKAMVGGAPASVGAGLWTTP